MISCEFNGFTRESLSYLKKYPWLGNVREMENIIEYSLIMSQGRAIGIEHLPDTTIRYQVHQEKNCHTSIILKNEKEILIDSLKKVEEIYQKLPLF